MIDTSPFLLFYLSNLHAHNSWAKRSVVVTPPAKVAYGSYAADSIETPTRILVKRYITYVSLDTVGRVVMHSREVEEMMVCIRM